MYTLYYGPGTCSMAVHVALNECNQPVKLEKVDSTNKSAEFLKYNPRGQVPVLIDDGTAIREGAAILIHILEKHNSPLMPKSGKERAAALEWLMFCNATLHPAYGRGFFLKRNGGTEAQIDAATTWIEKLWAEVEQKLGASSWLAGEQITIADILLTVIANWSSNLPKPITLGPRTKKLLQIVIARPTYKKALDAEQIEYKAAA